MVNVKFSGRNLAQWLLRGVNGHKSGKCGSEILLVCKMAIFALEPTDVVFATITLTKLQLPQAEQAALSLDMEDSFCYCIVCPSIAVHPTHNNSYL